MCSCDIRQALNILQYVTATKSLHDIISLQEVQKVILDFFFIKYVETF